MEAQAGALGQWYFSAPSGSAIGLQTVGEEGLAGRPGAVPTCFFPPRPWAGVIGGLFSDQETWLLQELLDMRFLPTLGIMQEDTYKTKYWKCLWFRVERPQVSGP